MSGGPVRVPAAVWDSAAGERMRAVHQGVAPAQRVALQGEDGSEDHDGAGNGGEACERQQHQQRSGAQLTAGEGAGVSTWRMDGVMTAMPNNGVAHDSKAGAKQTDSDAQRCQGDKGRRYQAWWPQHAALPLMRGAHVRAAASHAAQVSARDALAAVCPRLRPLPQLSAQQPLPGPLPTCNAHVVRRLVQACLTYNSQQLTWAMLIIVLAASLVCHLAALKSVKCSNLRCCTNALGNLITSCANLMLVRRCLTCTSLEAM